MGRFVARLYCLNFYSSIKSRLFVTTVTYGSNYSVIFTGEACKPTPLGVSPPKFIFAFRLGNSLMASIYDKP